jgi:hypothetical protein
MNRRNTEKRHSYSESIFSQFQIFDLQGLLHNGKDYACGVEAYQVKAFDQMKFEILDPNNEVQRKGFCELLGVPYYVIISSSINRKFRIYSCVISRGKPEFQINDEYTESQFASWWKKRQPFEQTKGMYNAKRRIYDSLIDNVLFANRLSWGINVDGFMLNNQKTKVLGIFEKRIRTKNGSYDVSNYDPNKYFLGTSTRAGDYASWRILHDLATKLGCKLYLLTFDDGPDTRRMGVAEIRSVTATGLEYSENETPQRNILEEPDEFEEWLKPRLMQR